MTLSDFYNEVARLADTDTQKISVSETKRVLAVAFQVLAAMSAADSTDVLAKGLLTASKKLAKG